MAGAALGAAVGAAVLLALSPTARLTPWAALALPIMLCSLWAHGLYRVGAMRTVPTGLPVASAAARALPLAVLATAVTLLASGTTGGVAALAAAAALTVPSLATVPAGRSLAVRVGRTRGLRRPQRVLVIGTGDAAEGVVSRLERQGGVTVVGMVDDDPLPGFESIGRVEEVPKLCDDLAVDRIVVALPRTPWLVVSEVLQPLIGRVDIAVLPSLHELVTWRSGTQDLAGMTLIPLVPAQHSRAARMTKRALDLAGAGVALVVFSPVLALSALAVKLDSPGPVFFRQERAGLGGEPFMIWKFRTMHPGAEAERDELFEQRDSDGPRFKMARDPRVTRVGKFLRRYSIDELPQLFNVFSGAMSLVGPRPYPMVESEALRTGTAASRFEVPPGMTGLWQVSGRSDLTWDDLCRLDAIYVRSWSLLWDLRILLQTPRAALDGGGAY